MAKQLKIHPAVGIARVGTSSEHFLGPEIPGTFAKSSDGSYRDASKKLRRQAVRFRVYEHDDGPTSGDPVEVIAGQNGVARVEWTVHLVNKKAVWFKFAGVTGEGLAGYPPGHPLRNGSITDPAEREKKLIINPGPRTISGPNSTVEISKGSGGGFPETWPGPLAGGKEITSLGTMRTDEAGRLIAAGGFGTSGTTGTLPPDGTLAYDNNDEWFDDVSDGTVTAKLIMTDGSTRVVKTGAWLIVAPPDYAPSIENLVTIYDLMYDLALRRLGFDSAIFNGATNQFTASMVPSFTKDIYPILRRAFDYRWVIQQAASHRPVRFDFDLLSKPAAPGETDATNPRLRVFDRLRNPMLIDDPAHTNRTMPKLHNDGIGGIPPETLRFTVTPTQYEMMRRWSAGNFIADWAGAPVVGNAITAAGLDRAALEAGCGGSFFPGMEASWNLRDSRVYLQPFEFRFRTATSESDPNGCQPGDVTKRSALPWQADFLKCGNNWWPAQRPDQVRSSATATSSIEWARGIESHVDLVEGWSHLGIVIPASNTASPAKFHESERLLP